MPFEISPFQLPCGVRAYRMETIGVFSGQDADSYVKQAEPGGPNHGLPCLVLTQRMESLSSEARGYFAARGDLGDREMWTAIVVTNPVIRVASNFVMRIQGTRKMKLFSGEAEALQWLDARVREALAAERGLL